MNGKMRLHIYLAKYREERCTSVESHIEKSTFEEEQYDDRISSIGIGNDIIKSFGRIYNTGKEYKFSGLRLRDKLRIALFDHDLHHLRKEDWNEDINIYVVRNKLKRDIQMTKWYYITLNEL